MSLDVRALYTTKEAKAVAAPVQEAIAASSGNPEMVFRLINEALAGAQATETAMTGIGIDLVDLAQHQLDTVNTINRIKQDYIPDNVAERAFTGLGGNADVATAEAAVDGFNTSIDVKDRAKLKVKERLAAQKVKAWLASNQDSGTYLATNKATNAGEWDPAVEATFNAQKDAALNAEVAKIEVDLQAGKMTALQLESTINSATTNPELKKRLIALRKPEETPELKASSTYQDAYRNLRSDLLTGGLVDNRGQVDIIALRNKVQSRLGIMLSPTEVTEVTEKLSEDLSGRAINRELNIETQRQSEIERSRANIKVSWEKFVRFIKIGGVYVALPILLGAGGASVGGFLGASAGFLGAIPAAWLINRVKGWDSREGIVKALNGIKTAQETFNKAHKDERAQALTFDESTARIIAIKAGEALGMDAKTAIEAFFQNEPFIKQRRNAVKFRDQLSAA